MIETCLEEKPRLSEVNRCIALFDSGQFEETIAHAKILLVKFPESQVLHEIIAAANLKLGKAEETIISYRNLLQINPEHADSYNNLGKVFFDGCDFSAAIAHYQRAVEIEPSFADAYFNLGNAFRKSGDLRKAIESYKLSLNISFDDIEVLQKLGEAFGDYGDFDQAISCYIKLSKTDPNLGDYQNNIDILHKKKESVTKDINSYVAEKQVQVKSKDYYNFLGKVFHERGFLETAIDNYEKSIAIDPYFREAQKNLGLSLTETEKYPEALELYKNIIEALPEDVDVCNNLGNVYRHMADVDASIELFTKSIQIQPTSFKSYVYMSASVEEKGDLNAAIKFCNQALRIYKDTIVCSGGNEYKIFYRYLSSNGLLDQNFQSFEIIAESESKALGTLQDILEGGLSIRIDRILNLKAPVLLSNKEKIKNKFKNKSIIQILTLILGGLLVTAASIARFLEKQM